LAAERWACTRSRLRQCAGMSPDERLPSRAVSDRERRIVSDLNTTYLSAEAMADIERLGIELVEGAALTVCDYDADEDGNPTWVIA
jgi:hypothetical protein